MVKRISSSRFAELSFSRNVSCIGFFDGVHRGHQQLIARTIALAESHGCRPSLICFEPDPLELISSKHCYHISDHGERMARFSELGIRDIFVIEFDEAFMNMSAHDFINDLLNRMDIVELVCGFDFRFGYQAKGDADLLKELGTFKTTVIDEVGLYNAKISSSRIRDELARGNFKMADRLLGYAYTVELKTDECLRKSSGWLLNATIRDRWNILNKTVYEDEGMRLEKGKITVFSDSFHEKGSLIRLRLNDGKIVR